MTGCDLGRGLSDFHTKAYTAATPLLPLGSNSNLEFPSPDVGMLYLVSTGSSSVKWEVAALLSGIVVKIKWVDHRGRSQ